MGFLNRRRKAPAAHDEIQPGDLGPLVAVFRAVDDGSLPPLSMPAGARPSLAPRAESRPNSSRPSPKWRSGKRLRHRKGHGR
jgi:hypothetical protein